MKIIRKYGSVNEVCHSSKVIMVIFKKNGETGTTLPYWKSAVNLSCGWQDVWPSTSACTSGAPILVHSWLPHTSPFASVPWKLRFQIGLALLGICCSQPVDTAVFSLPLPPPKYLFFFHFQRDIFLRRQTRGFDCCLWGTYLGLQ